jgi:4-carboxymuconolactone decarboxylase
VAQTIPEGSNVHTHASEERIPMPEPEALSSEQSQLIESLTSGPRGGVVGPFIPLMQCPRLLNLFEPLGTELRFRGRLEDRVREIVICAVAKHTMNQFEWSVHVPLAIKTGVSPMTISALLEGRISTESPEDERVALEFAQHLMSSHDVPDSLFAESKGKFGNEGIVELTALIGYFITVCWIMNVAHTQSDNDSEFGHVG